MFVNEGQALRPAGHWSRALMITWSIFMAACSGYKIALRGYDSVLPGDHCQGPRERPSVAPQLAVADGYWPGSPALFSMEATREPLRHWDREFMEELAGYIRKGLGGDLPRIRGLHTSRLS